MPRIATVVAVDKLWQNVVEKKLSLTGGVGPRRHGEAYDEAYELPNAEAYNETCAAIANALWNHRMFLLHGDGKYTDVLERILYNGFLSGVSLTGDHFFYCNPLAHDGHTPFNQGHAGRSAWFRTSCCPVNVVRFLPSIAGVSLYWFDDTGHGGCRVPQSWRVLYKDADQWKSVVGPQEFATEVDRFSQVEFEAVETTAIRLEVQLQPKYSAGILEWKVLPAEHP